MRYRESVHTVGIVLSIAATSCGGDDVANPTGTPDTGVSQGTGGEAGTGQSTSEPQAETGAKETSTTPPDAKTSDGDATLCMVTDAALVAPSVPDAIKVPAGATLVARFFAQGDQVYICSDTTSDAGDGGATYTWVLKAPDAQLFDPACMVVGAHYAGPTWWIAKDGSSVVGSRLASAPSPHAGAIPQLLLKAISHDADGGPGVFSNVTFIQRLDTTDGAAPASCTAADVGHELRVAYTAIYYFYTGGVADAGDASTD
jgi:uncharacterized protein DUF3455